MTAPPAVVVTLALPPWFRDTPVVVPVRIVFAPAASLTVNVSVCIVKGTVAAPTKKLPLV